MCATAEILLRLYLYNLHISRDENSRENISVLRRIALWQNLIHKNRIFADYRDNL